MSYNCTPDKPLRWAKNCNFSDLLHRQARDAVKIPQIAGHDCIAEFQSAGTDQKVGQRLIDSLGGPFPANAGCDFCRRFGYGLNRDGGFQLVEESAAAVAKLLRIGTVDAVADFRDADGAQFNRSLADRPHHTFDRLGCGTISPFGGNEDAGVEN